MVGKLCDSGQNRHASESHFPQLWNRDNHWIHSSAGWAGQGDCVCQLPQARVSASVGGHWLRYTWVSPYTPLGMFQQMKYTLKMHYDLFLTVSHFVPVLLSSFCCSGFQKIIPLPKLIEWATFKISQVIQSTALQSGSSNSCSQNHHITEYFDEKGGFIKFILWELLLPSTPKKISVI